MIAAAILAYLIIWLIRPFLLRHLLAKPNERSSHRISTPQGAGIAVIAATVAISVMLCSFSAPSDAYALAVPLSATLFLAAVGLADDLKSVPVLRRLLLQTLAVAAVVLIAPDDLRIGHDIPLWIERGLVILAGVWFVNLVNFMDGLDLMTVTETVPVTCTLVLLGGMGIVSSSTSTVAAALCGAIVGFAPFNRPPAKVFLGDLGSLPIGLLIGWCLLQLAYHQQLAAALLLPLYYLTDATLTLLRRIAHQEAFWKAHRSHFYQRATDNGYTALEVVSRVGLVNLVLAILAIASTLSPTPSVKLLLLAAGCVAVGSLTYVFARPKR
jgi:UDP-N-acetylmuramyl pentapeptide phosphotransferase/UDP-N-acetylglucosamine-1-phosphate transferase